MSPFASRQVVLSGQTGAPHASVQYTGGTTQADASGTYQITLPARWSGTVTPTLAGTTFTPPSRSYADLTASLSDQDFTAAPILLTIQGQVGRSGATVTYDGGSTTSDGAGAYVIQVPYGWSGTVTPTLVGYRFTPATRTFAHLTSSLAGQDFTSATAQVTLQGQAGLPGATITYDGGSTTADGTGVFTLQVPFGWSGTLTPSSPGYGFSPHARTLSVVQANTSGLDFQAAPVLPTGNALTAGSGGSLSLTADFLVNGLSISGTGVNLPVTGVRNNNATSFPATVPAAFPVFTPGPDTSISPLAPGTYGTVSFSGASTTSGGTYYIQTLQIAGGSTVTLGAGTYYISQITLGDGCTLACNGPVCLYLANGVFGGNFDAFNASGPTDRLLILLGASATWSTGNYTQFRGAIYGSGGNSTVSFGNNASLTGLVAVKGTLTFSIGSSITLSSADQAALGNLTTGGWSR